MSLDMAAEMSVKLLEASGFKNDKNILFFLGCLPGGVTKLQLRKMSSATQGIDFDENCLERLSKLSFFETGLADEFSTV